MKIVASGLRTGITVILSCNLCSWTPNYPALIPPISWHHTQLPPIIEPNQDFSQLNLKLLTFFVSPLSVSQCRTVLYWPGRRGKSGPISSVEFWVVSSTARPDQGCRQACWLVFVLSIRAAKRINLCLARIIQQFGRFFMSSHDF